MDPRNAREGLRDALLDIEEGADILMVKPGIHNLDLVWRLREACLLPLAVWLRADVATQAFAAVAALLVLFTHRANVQRLRAGTESRFERVRFWRRRA